MIRKTIKLHRAQASFRQSNALYRGFVGGIGSGKSWAGAYDLIRRAKKGRLYMAVGPTYPLLSDATIRTFLMIGHALGVIPVGAVHRTPPSVKLSTGAEILFRSSDDPDRLRGPNLSGAWLDEASLMDAEVFDVMIGRLREQGEQGWLSATFTPKGLGHWTYEKFGKRDAQGKPLVPNTELFFAKTGDNPFNPAGFADTLREQYSPQIAAQELDAQFCDVEGAEFPASWFGEHLWVERFPEQLTLRAMYLDPSVGMEAKKGDYSAYVLLGRDKDGTLYVSADIARRPVTDTIAAGISLAKEFQPLDAFGVEVNAFQRLMATELERQSKLAGIMLPIHGVTNNTNKHIRIRRITPYLARGNLRFVEGKGTRLLVQQLREFPMGQHDDGPDALEGSIRVALEVINGRKRRAG